MPSLENLILVTLAGLALSISPGPSMLYILSRSIGQSRAAGLASAVGLALGGVFLAVLTAVGLASIFKYSDTVYNLVRYIGAAYLIYLGLQMFSTSDNKNTEVKQIKKPEPLRRIVFQGVIVECLNPKTILFFMAFLPQFVDVASGSVTTQLLVLGMLVPLTAVPSDVLVAWTGGSLAKKLSESKRMHNFLQWLGGIFLIGLGLRLLLQEK